jgi:integrase
VAHIEDRWTVPSPTGRGRVKGPRHGVGKRWAACWTEVNGQRRKLAFDSKDAAVAHLEKVGVDQRSGNYVSPAASAVTVRDVAERWYIEQVHQRDTSLATIRRRLDRTILPSLGDVPWSKVDRSTIQAAVTSWSSSLAPSTVHVAYVYLAGVCALAVEERRVVASPCRRVNLPPVARMPVVPYSVAKVQQLTDAAAERYRPMFVLAAASGLRSGELRGLTWDRIEETTGGALVRVDRQLTRKATSSRPVWGPPKSASSVRVVAVGKATLEALGPRGDGGALVFTTTRGGAVTHKVAWQIWRTAADAVGVVAGEGWHELRHFHASLLIAGGSSPVAVAHRLGHRDATETLQTYAHLWPDDDERMRDATDGLIRLAEPSAEGIDEG